MKLEVRRFINNERKEVRHLLCVPEDEDECKLVDWAFGNKVKTDTGHIANVTGTVQLSDGYGELYIRLIKVPDSEG